MGRIIFFMSIMAISFLVTGCPEEMVGAPCVSETDNRKFNTELLSKTADLDTKVWSIETGSVQCATHLCLTQTKQNPDAKILPSGISVSETIDLPDGVDIEFGNRADACKAYPTEENCGAKFSDDNEIIAEPPLLKFSFCSCRCEDGDKNRYSDNPDKYSDLCECPPSTHCVTVLDKIGDEGDENSTGISPKLFGGYCVPECIANPCRVGTDEAEIGEVCTPSSNSEEPWRWSCEKITNPYE